MNLCKLGLLLFLSALSCVLFCCAPAYRNDELSIPGDPLAQRVLALRGKSLVQGLGACGFCHAQESERERGGLSGGGSYFDIYGEVIGANLTPAQSGLKGWSPNAIVRAIRNSVDKDGIRLSPTAHRGFEWLSDNDALAIVTYLKSIPAVENEISRRSVSMLSRNTTGMFYSQPASIGYVPEVDRRVGVAYGEYLADNVARCGSCHTTPATLFGSEVYLAGGVTVRRAKGERTAPTLIANDSGSGVSLWSEEEIRNYLAAGTSPDGKISDGEFCPTGFFRSSDTQELQALAAYLKSVSRVVQ